MRWARTANLLDRSGAGPERALGRLDVDGGVKGFWRISGTPVSVPWMALRSGRPMSLM
jgi:hypothetical protein